MNAVAFVCIVWVLPAASLSCCGFIWSGSQNLECWWGWAQLQPCCMLPSWDVRTAWSPANTQAVHGDSSCPCAVRVVERSSSLARILHPSLTFWVTLEEISVLISVYYQATRLCSPDSWGDPRCFCWSRNTTRLLCILALLGYIWVPVHVNGVCLCNNSVEKYKL